MGRPFGSTTGREPSGGYPDLSHADGGFLAGFIEGEASFGIRKQTRGACYRCAMTIDVRDDDESLVRALVALTRLGTVCRRPAYRSSNPQVSWRVAAKSDCLRLLQLLTRHPLRGRKANDLAIWKDAVAMWTSTNAGRWTRRDWSPIANLQRRLTERRAFDRDRVAVAHPALDIGRADWGPYLAGLLSAEGSFGILRNGRSNFLPQVHITLRADDRLLLDAIHRFTGVGRLYAMHPRRGNPMVDWIVRDIPGLFRLVELLDANPPRGRKAAEYGIWRLAVGLHGSAYSRADVRSTLERLRRDLTAARTYTSLTP
jgi:hypothetical protein